MNQTKNKTTQTTKNKTMQQTGHKTKQPPKNHVFAAVLAAMPLSVAVIPWGILCGTLSIESGLNSWQAQLMSLAVFAGAAQLAGLTIFAAAGSWANLLNSTTMISVRHLLYSAAYKDDVALLPLWKKLLFAFLLTDEMFAIAKVEQTKTGQFDYWYAVTAGFAFYMVWNVATFVGIFFANTMNNIADMGFDFAIAATFIAMIVPMVKQEMGLDKQERLDKQNADTPNTHQSIKDKATTTSTALHKVKLLTHPLFLAVMVSATMALVFAYLHIQQGLIFSTLIGMTVGAYLNRSKASTLTSFVQNKEQSYD